MQSLAPNLNVFANPICVRCARARLRWKHVFSWGLILVTVTGFICATVYNFQTERHFASPQQAAQSLFMPIIIIQAVVLMFLGTGAVASGLAREREGRLLDYARMTPMSPVAKILGYLFGLPAREYFLFALTLPFLTYAMLKSGYSWTRMGEFYVVFFSSVWLYHMTGMVAGMASSRPRFAAAIAQGMVVVLYFVLPRLGLMGFRVFEYLTMLPTFTRIVFEDSIGHLWHADPSYDPNRYTAVPFFDWNVHPTGFTLLVQGFILLFMFLVVYRKWKDERYHPLSKIAALTMFAGTVAFMVGNIWPLINREDAMMSFYRQFDPTARFDEDLVAPALVLMGIMFSFLMLSGLMCLFTINLITPSRHTTLSGWRQARKLGKPSPGWNADAASSLPVSLLMIVLTTAGIVVLMKLAVDNDQIFVQLPPVLWWIAPLALNAGVFLFVQGFRERFSARAFLVGTFVLWMIPFFVTVLLLSAFSQWTLGSYIGLPFPPFSQAMATFQFFSEAEVVNSRHMLTPPNEIASDMPTMVWVGTAFYVALGVIVQVELWRWKRALLAGDLARPETSPALPAGELVVEAEVVAG